MNFSQADHPTAARAHALACEIRDGALKLADIRAKVNQLLPDIRKAVEECRENCSKQNAKVAAWIEGRHEESMIEFSRAPVDLIGDTREEDVIACWREQLRQAAIAIVSICENQPQYGEWLYFHDKDDGRGDGHAFYCAEQVRDCFKEIVKLALLIDAPRQVNRPKCELLFSDDFRKPLAGWKTYGGEFSSGTGDLHVKGMGVTAWCEQEFNNACVAFDFQPVACSGNAFGSLFAFPGSPVDGHDYSISAGAMHLYNHGIDCYHCSLFRGNSGRTNLRRAGHGLKILSTVTPDSCGELGQTYRVELLRCNATVQVLVNRNLIHSYVDAGCYGQRPKPGRFGLRHFAGEGTYETKISKFQISKLV
jgi:hypothetical protein